MPYNFDPQTIDRELALAEDAGYFAAAVPADFMEIARDSGSVLSQRTAAEEDLDHALENLLDEILGE